MEVHFIVKQENDNAKKFRLNESEYVILGRSPKLCQVKLNDDLCSSTHCKISILNDTIFVEDLKSKNGIYLNGTRILKQRFFINDKVKFGRSTVYINPTRMEEDAILHFTFEGKTEQRILENVTLELTNVKKVNRESTGPTSSKDLPATNYTKTQRGSSRSDENSLLLQANRKNNKLTRQKSSSNHRAELVQPIPRWKLNTLKYIANTIDIFLLILSFVILVEVIRLTYPELDIIASKFHYILFLMKTKMLPYSLACMLIAVLIYRLNRGLEKGSVGERLMKIGGSTYK